MRTIIFILCLGAADLSYASSYQIEGGVFLSQSDVDDNSESDAMTLAGIYYFSDVELGSGPWREAPFLSRVGSVFLAYGKTEFDDGTSVDSLDNAGFGLSIIRPDSPVIASVTYSRSDGDFTTPIDSDVSADILRLEAGSYLSRNTAVAFYYQQFEGELKFDGVSFGQSNTLEFESTTFGAQAKTILNLLNSRFVGISGSYEVEEEDDPGDEKTKTLAIESQFYFNPKTHMGAYVELSNSDETGSDKDEYGLEFGAFITEHYFISVDYSVENHDEADDDESTVGLFFAMRY